MQEADMVSGSLSLYSTGDTNKKTTQKTISMMTSAHLKDMNKAQRKTKLGEEGEHLLWLAW